MHQKKAFGGGVGFRDVLEGGGGGLAGSPLLLGSPYGPLKFLKLKSSWHRRRRSKILALSLKHWKGSGGGGGILLRCTAVLIHHWGGGGVMPLGTSQCTYLFPLLQRETSTHG